MSVAAYPDGTVVTGPYINRLMDQPVEFQFEKYLFDDGGCNVNVQPCGVKRWVIEYDGLSVADKNVLVAHFNTARGRVETFDFYHRRSATTIEDVKYESLKVGTHPRYWANVVQVTLIKFL